MVRHQAIKKQKAFNRLKQEVLKKTIKKPEKRKENKRGLPAIVCDIDGVVVLGKQKIGTADVALRRVLRETE